MTGSPGKALLLLGWLAAAAVSSPRLDPSWFRLPAGTEITELRTPTSRIYSNGDGTVTADISPTGSPESKDSCQATSTGYAYYWWDPHGGGSGWSRYGPALHYGTGNSGAAYAKFDLAPIPDSSIILNAQFRCYQYEVGSTPVRTACTHPSIDLDSANAEDVYYAVVHGQVLAETSFSNTGWAGYDMGEQGATLLQDCLQQTWVTLGIKPVAGSATSYGTNGDDKHARLRIIFADTSESDIQALRTELLTYPLVAWRADTALLVLRNRGLRPSEPVWAYAASPGLPSESTHAGVIQVGWLANVKLPLPVPHSPETLVDYALWTACTNDPWHADDTARLACWVFPPNTYYAEGFDVWLPPLRWVVVDNDHGSESWQRSSDDSLVHSGAGLAMCAREQSRPNDDWLISGPVYPKTGQPDSLGFFCRLYQAGPPMNLQTWAMRGQRVSDTVRRLTSGSISDTSYQRQAAPLDEFDGDTVYVGFRCQSSGDWNGLCLDDVWFSSSDADIQIVRAEPPYPLVTGRANTALLVLTNKGPRSSDDIWTYATAPGLAPESARAGVIAVGETASVKLPLPVPRSTNAMVDYTLWTEAAWPDGTAKLTCWAFPPKTYYAEGFDVWLPPLHWVVVDNDTGVQCWQRRSADSVVHSGAGFGMCAREQSGPNDDWLISGPVYPRTGQPDSLGFFCRLYQAGPPMNLQTWAMRGPRITDTIRSLTSESVSQRVYRSLSVSLDGFDGDAIYIGFRCQSSGAGNSLCLDDVWFCGFVPPDTSDTTDTLPPPPPQRDVVQRASTKLPDFAFARNPTGSRFVTVRSALAVGKRRILTMRDVLGRTVRTFLLNPTGIAHLDLRGLPAGVYMATLEAGTESLTRKLVITSR